jgi:GH25 family lysozyme M1 (1,4-beta-N-acetylmuramidase)
MSSLAIDLSAFNSKLSLNDIQLDEVSIICCRASIGTRADSCFNQFAAQYLQQEQRFFWGAYHVVTNDDPDAQLHAYASSILSSKAVPDLIPVLDIETNGLSIERLRDTVRVFEQAYDRLCIYTYQGYITNERFMGYDRHPLWLAYYPRAMPREVMDGDASTTPKPPTPPTVWRTPSLWQLNGNDTESNAFSVAGVDVDLSICYDLNSVLVINHE